jgi:PAS domain S-box-containing protein
MAASKPASAAIRPTDAAFVKNTKPSAVRNPSPFCPVDAQGPQIPHHVSRNSLKFSDWTVICRMGMLSKSERGAVPAVRSDATPRLRRERVDVLADVLQELPIGVYIVDARGRIREANAIAERAFGVGAAWRELSFSELVPRLWPKGYADFLLARFEQTLASGEPYRHSQHSARRLDRDRVEHYEWEIRRIEYDEGEAAVVCTFRDIAERVATEQALEAERTALQQKQERLDLAQRATGLGIFDWHLADTATEISPEWRRIYGLPEEGPVPNFEQWTALIHPEDRERTIANARAATDSRTTHHDEFRVVWPDGSVHWVASASRTLCDSDGRPARILGTVMDISERKAAERRIAENEQRLRLAIQIAPLCLFAVDLNLRCTWVYRPMFDFTEFAIIGKRDDELMSPEEAAPFIAFKQHVLDTGHTERRLLHVSVGQITATHDVTLEPLRDADGRITGLVGASMDITDLADAKAAAEAASRAKDDFLAVLSHELRTPLTPVLANAILLERDPALSSEHRSMMSAIRRNIELEARLIDDLLDATRISRNKLTLQKTLIDAHQILNWVLEMVRAEADNKGLEVAFDLGASMRHVHVDPARFQQILWNLLKNAIKFTPTGGHVKVLTTNPTAGCLRIVVADTGVGIEPQALPNIFAAFEQGGYAVTQRFGGLGLGLAISQALAQLHEGRITAASAGAGAGSTFTFELPASDSGAPSAIALPDAQPLACNCRILLVEDNADTRQVMELALCALACSVTTAGSIAAAIASAERAPFDLLISDIGLPDGSGLTLMRELRSRYRLRGIALSGFGREQDLAKSKEAGFDAHLVKPVSIELLEQTVRELSGRVRWSAL